MKGFILWVFCMFISIILLTNIANKTKNNYPSIAVVNGLTNPTEYNPVSSYEGQPDQILSDVQCPIPPEDRVPNKTGIQCVWSSIETLARWADFERLYDMTERPECRSYSSPTSASAWLIRNNVRFEQTTNKNNRSLIIKGCITDGRAVAFAVPGHMMVLVHYDEEKGIVKYINNSDSQLRIRTWSMEEFNRRWDGWLLIIYPDGNDQFPRIKSLARDIPIINQIEEQKKYPIDYIPLPSR